MSEREKHFILTWPDVRVLAPPAPVTEVKRIRREHPDMPLEEAIRLAAAERAAGG